MTMRIVTMSQECTSVEVVLKRRDCNVNVLQFLVDEKFAKGNEQIAGKVIYKTRVTDIYAV